MSLAPGSSSPFVRSSPRTVVLATNQLSFVQQADLVLFVQHGTIVEQGSYAALMGE